MVNLNDLCAIERPSFFGPGEYFVEIQSVELGPSRYSQYPRIYICGKVLIGKANLTEENSNLGAQIADLTHVEGVRSLRSFVTAVQLAGYSGSLDLPMTPSQTLKLTLKVTEEHTSRGVQWFRHRWGESSKVRR